MSKDTLVDRIKVSRRQLDRYLFFFVRGADGEFVPSGRPKLSDSELVQPGSVGVWSLSDLLLFVTVIERRFVSWYQAGAGGEIDWVLSPQDLDALTVRNFDYPLDDIPTNVWAETSLSFQKLIETVVSIPEAHLQRIQGQPDCKGPLLEDVIANSSYHVYDWAKNHLRRWRKSHASGGSRKSDLLARIQMERRRLEQNLSRIEPVEMIQPGVIGDWSIKDILAHLMDWEKRFVGWYAAGLRGEMPETPAPGLTWRDLDILNRQIYEKYQDWPLAEVLTEFRISYDRTLETVQGIPEADLYLSGRYPWLGNGNLVGYILANTANHYRWAKTHIRKWLKQQP